MSGAQQQYRRFTLAQRVEHVVMFTSFIVLAVTGLPQKFAEAGLSVTIINLLGGIESTRQIHHVAAIVLILSSGFHFLTVGYRVYVKRSRLSMLPGLKDVKDGATDFLFNFGLRKNRSQGGRYNWMEKVEYWSLVWGTLVMILTGFMLWNPIAVTTSLPGEVIPAAKTAHGWEAVLAVLAVIIWHFYSVHLRHFNKSMFTGKMSEHEMLDEHPLELADIKAGLVPTPRDPHYARRQKIYTPLAAIASVAIVVLVYQFMTFETTAVETVLPRTENVQVFAPLAPTPLPTPRPTSTPRPTPVSAVADWTTVRAALELECAGCHNGSVAGLDFTSYAGVMKGGNNGPVVAPGEPADSLIVNKVAEGTHPGKLAPAELVALQTWITNGASETGGGVVVSGGAKPAGGEGWTGGIDQLVAAKCANCHVNSSMGDLSLKTYADALQGGKSGAVIVPGEPDQSLFWQVQQAGGHPGQFDAAELDRVRAWIKAGAPETAGASEAAPAATPAPVAVSNWTAASALFTARCAMCHVNAQAGNLSLKTYDDMLKGGKAGPAIVPGDPDGSPLVQIQQKGGHPGMLSAAELAGIIAWIEAGAPQE
jgi:cytochrome b subunit of formate dehydrogenase